MRNRRARSAAITLRTVRVALTTLHFRAWQRSEQQMMTTTSATNAAADAPATMTTPLELPSIGASVIAPPARSGVSAPELLPDAVGVGEASVFECDCVAKGSVGEGEPLTNVALPLAEGAENLGELE